MVEKETKTKTFSKEGLARQDKLDPEEQKRSDTVKWIAEVVDQLQTLIDEQDLDLWRGEDASHFVRPKWGIYRSILDRDNLRPDEETVRFANFSISEVAPAG